MEDKIRFVTFCNNFWSKIILRFRHKVDMRYFIKPLYFTLKYSISIKIEKTALFIHHK